MAEDFEAVKAFLKQTDKDGSSVYNHIAQMLLKIGKEKPENALSIFENLSIQTKQSELLPKQFREMPAEGKDSESRSRVLASVDRTVALTKVVEGDGAEDAEDEEGEGPILPDMITYGEYFEWAGISLGKEELYKIMLSIQALVKKQAEEGKEINNVRFFGKIFGLKKDYLIVECKYVEAPDDEIGSAKAEKPGDGANEFIYFCTNSPEYPWVQLPYVTPEQILLARQMRRFFTGDLKASVLGFPRFPWNEASYLRAQIARISHSTVISPKGFYIEDPEAEEEFNMIEDEDFAGVPTSELLTNEGWCHHRKFLMNSQGRCTPYREGDGEDGDEDEEKEDKEEEEEEDIPQPLSSVDTSTWTYRLSPVSISPHAIASAHCLQWPGAVSVCRGKIWTSIYIGFGHKLLANLYTPPPPPLIQAEYVPVYSIEDDEPNPLQEQVDPLPAKKGEAKEEEDDEEGEEDDDDY